MKRTEELFPCFCRSLSILFWNPFPTLSILELCIVLVDSSWVGMIYTYIILYIYTWFVMFGSCFLMKVILACRGGMITSASISQMLQFWSFVWGDYIICTDRLEKYVDHTSFPFLFYGPISRGRLHQIPRFPSDMFRIFRLNLQPSSTWNTKASIMDGFAVCSSDGIGTFPVDADAFAGREDLGPLRPGYVRYITTGSAVPKGADAVVKVEDTVQLQWLSWHLTVSRSVLWKYYVVITRCLYIYTNNYK